MLQTSLAPDLWPIMADPASSSRSLVNLAVNARDAMPDGGTLTLDTENVDGRRRLREHAAGRAPGPLRPAARPRHRRRDGPRDVAAARVRAVLHHQGQGRGHRPRPGHRLRHRHPGRRARPDLLRAGPRARRSRSCCRRPTRPSPARPATAHAQPAPRRRRDDPRRRGRAGDARGDPPDPREQRLRGAGRGRRARGARSSPSEHPGDDRPAADRRRDAGDARQGGRRARHRAAPGTSASSSCRATRSR